MSLLGAAYFAFFGIGCAFFTLPDKYGRRWTLFGMSVGYQLGVAVALFINNIWAKIIGQAIMGIMHMRSSLTLAVIFELMTPTTKK